MNYDKARKFITDGDMIAVRETHGFLTLFTKFFTRSGYTHTGIAIWIDDGLWLAELNAGKNHLIPLSQLADTDFDAYHCPISDVSMVRAAVLQSLRVKIPYGFAALFVIGLLCFLRLKVFLHARKVLVCSGYCVSVYEAAGWPERSRLLSPQQLADMLLKKLEVRK